MTSRYFDWVISFSLTVIKILSLKWVACEFSPTNCTPSRDIVLILLWGNISGSQNNLTYQQILRYFRDRAESACSGDIAP